VLYYASLDEHSVYYLNRQAIEIGQFAGCWGNVVGPSPQPNFDVGAVHILT
jgi:hypothetical protein